MAFDRQLPLPPPTHMPSHKSNFQCECCWLINGRVFTNLLLPPLPTHLAHSLRLWLNNFVEDFIELNQFRMHVYNAAGGSSSSSSCCCFLLFHWWCHTIFRARIAYFPAPPPLPPPSKRFSIHTMQSDRHAARRVRWSSAPQSAAISSCCQHQYPLGDNIRWQADEGEGRIERSGLQPVANPVSSSVAKLILPAPRLSQKLSSSSAQLKLARSRVGGREVASWRVHLAFKILKWAWRQLNDNRSSSSSSGICISHSHSHSHQLRRHQPRRLRPR